MLKEYNATKQIVERYTCGDCYILAPELHKQSGWKVAMLHNGDRDEDLLEGVFVSGHVFCISDCGQFAMDVRGIRSIREMKAEWLDRLGCNRLYIYKSFEDYLKQLEMWPDFSREEQRRARQTAKRVVDCVIGN